jgi:hypothetical protein
MLKLFAFARRAEETATGNSWNKEVQRKERKTQEETKEINSETN